jgi:hypothetical protein
MILSFVSAIVFVIALMAVGRTNIKSSGSALFGTNLTVYSSVEIESTGPNYFYPNAEIFAYFESPYADALKNVDYWMSLDNSSWVKVPFSGVRQEVSIGKTSLNGFPNTVYFKCYCPEENVTVQGRSESIVELLNSSTWGIFYTSIFTSQSLVLMLLVGIAVFSFLLQILDFMTRER